MGGGSAETIAAIATAPGIGAVGIVRVAGPKAGPIAEVILRRRPEPRRVHVGYFYGAAGEELDQGLAVFFRGPRSFTGDDLLELHGHGGRVVLDLLLARVVGLGARIARPGEFTERAFLNGKLDLTQAEAIADLIEAGTATAARLAARTLKGALSRRVEGLAERLIELRTLIEASLDFPDEDLDEGEGPRVGGRLRDLVADLGELRRRAEQARLLHDGLTVVIAGAPNAGKSSLMNALVEQDRAIVTAVPGTTRDVLRERVQIDGLLVELVDTAGMRESEDPIEREGVRRAEEAVQSADHILWVVDDKAALADGVDRARPDWGLPTTLVRNKVDLTGKGAFRRETMDFVEIGLSAKSGEGLELLREHLRRAAGIDVGGEGEFLARRRHVDALERAHGFLQSATAACVEGLASELLAEELRLAQQALGEITGAVTSEDLLDRIFSEFCIGK